MPRVNRSCGSARRVAYFVLPSDLSQGPSAPRVSLAWATLAAALMVFWQFVTVHYNWDGNWTALFCTGQLEHVPPQLQPGTYLFKNSIGYDGQMYRYIAHDPFATSGWSQYFDAPVLRYRRILVPLLAFAVAGGRQGWIDAAYIAVIAAFVLAGSYWLSRWAMIHGRSAAWGMAFLLAPATLVSMDRMTVDVALAALTVGFAYYAAVGSSAGLYSVLLLACLTRETGVLLVAAAGIFELWSRRFTRAFCWASAALPAAIWYLFVSMHLHADRVERVVPGWFAGKPGWGILAQILHPQQYGLPPAIEAVTRTLDVIALLGILAAVVAAIVLLFSRPADPLRLTGVMFAAVVILLTRPRYWDGCFGYSRVLTPLLLVIALDVACWKPAAHRWWWGLVPWLLVDLRVGLQLAPQALGILKGIARG